MKSPLLRCILILPAMVTPATAGDGDAFEVRVESPGPSVIADAVIQKAIDTVAARGGGVVLLGAGDFKLSRQPGDQTIVITSNVTLRGQGYATHIYLDPKTPANPARYYPVRIGSETTPANNVVIENLRYTGNNAAIGGGSIMGFNARLGAPSAWLLSSENVTVRDCRIEDAQQAAGCTKERVDFYPHADRLASQFRNWQVYHNTIDTCGNKAVELAECDGGLIADNHITNTFDGPQVICGSRNVEIRGNVVYYTNTGINITEGSNHIRVSGNHVEPMPAINKGNGGSALIFRTEPQAQDGSIFDITVTGNVFRDQTTRLKRTVRFQTRKEAIHCTYQGITFNGNVFDGDVCFLDTTTPAKTLVRDIVFADNVCEGDLISAPNSTMASNHVLVRGNMLRKAGDYTLNANQWIWSGNTLPAGTLHIAAGARGNVVHDNVTAAAISDDGTGNDLTANAVMADLPPNK